MAVDTMRLLTRLGLGVYPQNIKDPELYAQFQAIYDAIRELAQRTEYDFTRVQDGTLDPPNAGLNHTLGNQLTPYNNYVKTVASEAILPGSIINYWNDAGIIKARNANATDATKPGMAYAFNRAPIAPGGIVWGCTSGWIDTWAGLTPGAIYYLSTIAGNIQIAAPAVPGNIRQPVGVAMDGNYLWYNIALHWTVA